MHLSCPLFYVGEFLRNSSAVADVSERRGYAGAGARGECIRPQKSVPPFAAPSGAQRIEFGPCGAGYHRRPGSRSLSKIVTIVRVDRPANQLAIDSLDGEFSPMGDWQGD